MIFLTMDHSITNLIHVTSWPGFILFMMMSAGIMESYSSEPMTYDVVVELKDVFSDLPHFWESTGFCPPQPHQSFENFFLTDDQRQNLAYIGSTPYQGIRQVRIHWLLDLIKVKRMFNKMLVYDFTYLDESIDLLHKNGLQPGFEIMGNPSNIVTDFEDSAQLYEWRDLVTLIAMHFIGRYGIDEVSQWNFESWNEPENHDFDGLNITLQGYLNYYDACSEGLQRADNRLKIGGPATGHPDKCKYFWALLQHCFNGTNFFTGEKGVRLDFISFHIKGKGHSMYILEQEILAFQKIQEFFPQFASLPIYNDEADPLVGWSKGEEWRADARYASVVAKIVCQHQNILSQKYKGFKKRFSLLSNDNGFLNYHPHYFDQRTLLARFQMNTSSPRKIEFIKKPVLNVMGLLSLLGNKQVNTTIYNDKKKVVSNDSDVAVLASLNIPAGNTTLSAWELAILIVNSNDTSNKTGTSVVNLHLRNVDSAFNKTTDVLYVVYQLDDLHGNPYALWKLMGKPVFPSDEQLLLMRKNQEPVKKFKPKVLEKGTEILDISFVLALPAVMLLHFCEKPLQPPDKVSGLYLSPVSSYEVLVVWKDVQARCLLTYEVFYSDKSCLGHFMRVNHQDLIFTAFHHNQQYDRKSTSVGCYMVRAVDFWQRIGPFSEPKAV